MFENLMMGRTSDETYRELYKLSQSDELATNRLIRTESAYAANQAIAQAYEDAGFERYVFVSAFEARTCPKCGAMDGESFPLSEKKVGKNYPPVHPWCRCTTKPDDEDLKALEKDSSRWARDPETGEFVKARGDMTYKEWKAEQERIHGEKSFSAMQKKVWNLKRDKKQLEKYQKLIGLNRFTQDIKAFQNMKYGDKEVYSLVKLDYRRQLTLKKCPNLALPNAGQATIADTKFTGYLFNPENKKGWVKGVAFTSRLGYDISNWQELQKELLACATKYPAIRGETNEHGTKHTQKAVLYGKKDKPANVVIGWKCKDEKSWMTTTYIREVSKDD
ncbi:MAG: minor capsid protein [Eubacteriales bacterium]|nr:minor capsid protein [Eubacteriales bacterium]MDD3882327.1 minor capsid protein [Eubacteriales bacterium]MDD4512073.1 minor capsid protein [Eubacteriales bacterium]